MRAEKHDQPDDLDGEAHDPRPAWQLRTRECLMSPAPVRADHGERALLVNEEGWAIEGDMPQSMLISCCRDVPSAAK